MVSPNFSIAPDNTSQYYICWSPMDVIWASDAGGWGAGKIHQDALGHIPVAVEINAELEIGNNGTPTYFGWANYMMYHIRRIPVSGWGSPYATKNVEAICFFGTADYGTDDTVTPVTGNPAFLVSNNAQGWEGAAGFGAETNTDSRVSASYPMNGFGSIGGTFGSQNTYALFVNNQSGRTWSYHNVNQTGIPSTSNSIGDYCFYTGGTWGGALWAMSSVFNVIVINMKGEMVSGSSANFAGFGWFGGNSSETGEYFTEQRNTNLGMYNTFQDGDGRDCDYWYIDSSGTKNWNWIEKKSLDITVVDSKSKLAIQGATIEIKNINSDIVSETDSGTDITADMTDSTTSITVDLRENLTTGDLIRIDNEYITLGTVSGTGAGTITGCAREARYPSQFEKKIHKYNTSTFDKNIYITKSLTTDTNGQIGTQWITFATMVADSTGSGFPSQVTKGGINYTCNTIHQADLGTNNPPNASFWDVSGSEGFPWTDNKFYTDGSNGKRSYVNHGPFTITVKKAGYKKYTKTFSPTIDTEATVLTVELERPSLSLAKGVRIET